MRGLAEIGETGMSSKAVGLKRAVRSRVVATATAALALSLAGGATAHAAQLSLAGMRATDDAGLQVTQAGAHPNLETRFDLTSGSPTHMDANFKDVHVSLPPGLVIDPSVLPKCSEVDLRGPTGGQAACSRLTQVGVLRLGMQAGAVLLPPTAGAVPLYNIEPPPGVAGRLAANLLGVVVSIDATVRTGGDYGIDASSLDTAFGLSPFYTVRAEIWGIPAAASHDAARGGVPNPLPAKPMVSYPSDCSSGPLSVTARLDYWDSPGVFQSLSNDHDLDGNVLSVTGCEGVGFSPRVSFRPRSGRAGVPTGVDVGVEIPQSEDPDAPATALLHEVEMLLPEGMTVNPSSADGLEACAPGEIRLDDASDPSCPDASKLGEVSVETPLLDDPMSGGLYLARQGDNPFGSLIALYLVAKGPGVVIKLPGEVRLDSDTGRLTVSFDENPQLPFSKLSVALKGGPRAALTNPDTCGVKTTEARFTPWSAADRDNPTADELEVSTDAFQITVGPDGGPCAASGGDLPFDPAFEAGSVDPIAGVFSTLATRVTTGDGRKDLGRIEVEMPEGVLAKLKGVPLCTNAQAASAAGKSGLVAQGAPSCPAASQVGSTTVGAGTASAPFYPRLPGMDVSGRVFLTEGYKGAPYGLAIEVPAVAGPFDLGDVMVRAAVHVDRDTAQVSVISDQLPRILQGIPLEMRDVRVAIDRPEFATNPTGCDEKAIAGRIAAQDATTVQRSQRFQVRACRALEFHPRLALRFTGKGGRLKTGGNPGVRGVLTHTGSSLANIARGRVTMPKAVVLDPVNTEDPNLLCSYDDGLAGNCPASSVIGKATAVSPLLNKQLSGPVHLVQGIRFGPTGNRIRTTPTLLVKLRGDVQIDLRARTSVNAKSRLVTTFTDVPDAAVSKFTVHVNGGKKGILTVTRTAKGKLNLCTTSRKATLALTAHNRTSTTQTVNGKARCSKPKPKPKRQRLKHAR